jgi:hypothetical protein
LIRPLQTRTASSKSNVLASRVTNSYSTIATLLTFNVGAMSLPTYAAKVNFASFTVPSRSVDLLAHIGSLLVNTIWRPGSIGNQWDVLTPDPAYKQFGGELTFMHTTGNSLYIRTTPLSIDGNLTSYFVTSELFGFHKDSLMMSTHTLDTALFEIAEPVIKKEIYDVKYDIPNTPVDDSPPLIALNTTVRNDSSSAETKQTLTYSYSKSEVGTWNNTAGIELGMKTEVKCKVPFLAEGRVEVSASASYSHEWGGSTGTEKVIGSSTEVTVPPGKKGKALVLIKQAEINVGFSYKEKIIYSSGETRVLDKKGTYYNVESYGVDVQVGDWEPV